jgi:hypothetical protein
MHISGPYCMKVLHTQGLMPIHLLSANAPILWRFALPRAGWWRTAQRARLPLRPLRPRQLTREEALTRPAWGQYRSWSGVTSGVVRRVMGAVQYGPSKVAAQGTNCPEYQVARTSSLSV